MVISGAAVCGGNVVLGLERDSTEDEVDVFIFGTLDAVNVCVEVCRVVGPEEEEELEVGRGEDVEERGDGNEDDGSAEDGRD